MNQPLDITVPAESARLHGLRQNVDAFLEGRGAGKDVRARAVMAVHEACANVVRHAYGPEGGPLFLRGYQEGNRISFVVSDHGTPVIKPRAGAGAGLGLRLIARLADVFRLEGPGMDGTRVHMSFELAPSSRSDDARGDERRRLGRAS